MNKILSIAVLAYNKFSWTKNCLTQLSHLPNDHEIIVFDNGSSDETKDQLEKSNEIVYIRSNINKGFAFGCNQSYKASTAPNVLFLNNDIKVTNNHSSWTQELIKECPNGLVGPTMGQLDKNLNFIKESNEILNGNSYMSGWCLASSKEIWDKLRIPKKEPIQIFSEEFFCYFEDTDLSFRARKLKIPFRVIKIPVVHFGKISSQQLNTFQLYTIAREKFVKKWS